MSRNIYRKVGEMDYDGLIVGLNPEVIVNAGTIRKLGVAATLIRGTILAKSSADNKLVVLGSAAAAGEQKFNGDGSVKVFTVTAKPAALTSVSVGGTASTDWVYDASTGKITFGTAPASGTNNVVAAYASEVLTPDCILCDDAAVGTAADLSVAVYVAGCFDTNKVTVASGYTITTADKDKLRERGIYFDAASKAN